MAKIKCKSCKKIEKGKPLPLGLRPQRQAQPARPSSPPRSLSFPFCSPGARRYRGSSPPDHLAVPAERDKVSTAPTPRPPRLPLVCHPTHLAPRSPDPLLSLPLLRFGEEADAVAAVPRPSSRLPTSPRLANLSGSSAIVLSIDRWPQLELGSTEAPDPFSSTSPVVAALLRLRRRLCSS